MSAGRGSYSYTTIKYTNRTKRTDFTVVVYAANLYSAVGELSVAYQVLKTQSTITFEHPKSYGVSAEYKQGGQTISAGPISAEPGNQYEIVKANSSDTAIIREVPGHYVKNSLDAITVANIRPKSWPGQLFNVQLHKGSSVILIQPNVHTGNQAIFMMKSTLKFAVTRNVAVGDTFTALEMSSNQYEVDIENFPRGVEVILTEKPGGLLYEFNSRDLFGGPLAEPTLTLLST